jgi:hypothetical protein
MENEEAVGHDAIPHVYLGVALVTKLIFKKNHLSIVQDWVILTKHMKRDFHL